MKRQFALTLTLLISLTGWATAGIINVPADYTHIHDAVQACAAGDTVLVAPGSYSDCTHPTEGAESRPACVIMKSGVTLLGSGADQTVINANGLGNGIFVEGVSNCRIEKLSITRAFAEHYGSAILVRNVNSSVVMEDLRIFENTDGGIVCINSAHPEIIDCLIENNEAKQGGGLAIEENSNPLVSHCTILNNLAPSGGGIFIRSGCNTIIEFSSIENNAANRNNGHGGGLAVQSSTAMITDCTIIGNSSMGHGGGIAFSSSATGTLQNSLIQGNDCAHEWGSGGGLYTEGCDPHIINCVIAGNTCSTPNTEGGGIDIQFSPFPTLTNCTFVNNSVSTGAHGGAISLQWGASAIIERCIIANSTAGQGLYCIGSTPVINCCDIFGNAGGDEVCGTDAGGNFSADPGFCDAIGGLNSGGPCAAGNHPDGLCDGLNIGAARTCGGTPAPDALIQSIILGNMPNPFNPMTVIYFDLPQSGSAQLSIYTLDGRLVTTKSWDNLPQGRTKYQWNGTNLNGRSAASGVYLYRVDSQGQSSTKRMSLIR